jgi:hypothetical protein
MTSIGLSSPDSLTGKFKAAAAQPSTNGTNQINVD